MSLLHEFLNVAPIVPSYGAISTLSSVTVILLPCIFLEWQLNSYEKNTATKEADETTVVKTVEEEEEPTPTAAQTAPKSEWGGMNFGQDSDNVSNNKFASGSNMNSGNVITGRPSSRVLNPPGGKSSISLF
uniref:Uncharacterized protein n=1 Tax=Ditylum brightwellii TaxID=49249 RepID=A0A7S4UJL3_9STRA